MLNKRKLNHQYGYLRHVKAWYLLILAVFFLALGIVGLRDNYSTMVKLREAVAKADQQNGDVETALRDLRQHVYAHMNTELSSGNVAIKPPIQLTHRYQRLSEREAGRVKKVNQQVRARGEKLCARKFPAGGFNSPRVQCVAEYTRVNSTDGKTIPSELYKFDFISPGWSPDFAGINLLLSLLFFAGFATRAIVGWWYKLELRRKV